MLCKQHFILLLIAGLQRSNECIWFYHPEQQPPYLHYESFEKYFEKFHFRCVFVVGLTLGRRFAINLCRIGTQETRRILQAPMESKWCYFMRLTSREEDFTQADFTKNLEPWITKKRIPLGKYRDLRKKHAHLHLKASFVDSNYIS